MKLLVFHNELHSLLHYTLSGRRVLKNPSPNQLQLRLRTELEPRPAVQPALGDRPDSFSLLGQTSASMTDRSPSRSGRSSPASPTVSATRLRRLKCSGETLKSAKCVRKWTRVSVKAATPPKKNDQTKDKKLLFCSYYEPLYWLRLTVSCSVALIMSSLYRSTSKINGIAYVPFMSVDLRERFAFPVPFSWVCFLLF